MPGHGRALGTTALQQPWPTRPCPVPQGHVWHSVPAPTGTSCNKGNFVQASGEKVFSPEGQTPARGWLQRPASRSSQLARQGPELRSCPSAEEEKDKAQQGPCQLTSLSASPAKGRSGPSGAPGAPLHSGTCPASSCQQRSGRIPMFSALSPPPHPNSPAVPGYLRLLQKVGPGPLALPLPAPHRC